MNTTVQQLAKSTIHKNPSSSKIGWKYIDGILHCDGMSLEHLRNQLIDQFDSAASPFFVYSQSTFIDNIYRYTNAFHPLGGRAMLSYSIKANNNPRIIDILCKNGVSMVTCVSGNELQLAIQMGFPPYNILLNGTGKRKWEVELAIRGNSLLNIDSIFDAKLVITVLRSVNGRARVLLRINPNINVNSHPYLTTAHNTSKFGVEEAQVHKVLEELNLCKDHIEVVGVHVHIGSAITQVDAYAALMTCCTQTLDKIRNSGWPDASIINLGGGLDVDYSPPLFSQHEANQEHSELNTQYKSNQKNDQQICTRMELQRKASENHRVRVPMPQELIELVTPLLPDDVTLIIEPGRSLVATAGVLVTEVLGVKSSGDHTFVVVDAAMTEVIRPALYQAKHHITHLTLPPHTKESCVVNIVGPVCESGDFLARDYVLPGSPPVTSSALAMWTTGAYCASMASNYNLRPRAIEVMVCGPESYEVIRRPQRLEDIIKECL